jgi:hypothetical protein
MPKAMYLVVLLVIAAIAAGVYFGTDLLNPPQVTSGAAVEATPDTSNSAVAQLVSDMTSIAQAGGYAATFSEQQLVKWQLAEGHKIERFSIGNENTVFARLTSGTALDQTSVDWAPLGLSTLLPLDFATQSAGKKIEVGVIARSAQSNGAAKMMIVYATQQAGNSGWQQVQLQSDFALFRFTFEVPIADGGYTNQPIVVIHSDASGSGKAVELIGTYVKVLQ